MYFKTILLLSLVSAVCCVYEEEKYYRTPPPPRILSHKQAQNHDGGFKFAFAAENGLAQTEVIAPDGSRNGGYTYVDPHGKTITVKYTAGKEGFRILQGEHIPKEVHASQQLQQAQQTHQPQYGPQPHYLREQSQDDGSYKPERYEQPYNNPKPVQLQYQHHQQQPEQPVYQEARVTYKQQPQYVLQQQPQYLKAAFAPQPRQYVAAQEAAPVSNSVEADPDNPKEPEYHDEPGKAYSFGNGYTFHFSS